MSDLESNDPRRRPGWTAPSRLARVLGITIGVLLAVAAHAQDDARKGPPTTWHATAYVRSSMGMRVIDYWSRGPDMVARTVIRGHPITTIVSNGRYVAFDGITGQGIDIARARDAMALDAKRTRPFAFELDEIRADGGEKIEDVVLGSMRGEIWQLRDDRGRRKLWISSRPPVVPLRMETFDRAAGETVELDYQGWIFDIELPERFFSAPGGLAHATLRSDDLVESEAGREAAAGADPLPGPPLRCRGLEVGAAPRRARHGLPAIRRRFGSSCAWGSTFAPDRSIGLSCRRSRALSRPGHRRGGWSAGAFFAG